LPLLDATLHAERSRQLDLKIGLTADQPNLAHPAVRHLKACLAPGIGTPQPGLWRCGTLAWLRQASGHERRGHAMAARPRPNDVVRLVVRVIFKPAIRQGRVQLLKHNIALDESHSGRRLLRAGLEIHRHRQLPAVDATGDLNLVDLHPD
jgi:hypothetical protein